MPYVCFYDLIDWMMLWDLRENLLKVFSFFYYWCNMEGEVLPSRCTVIINLNLTWEYNQSILWDITCIYLKNMNPICLFPGSWNQWAWWKQKMEFLFTSSVCRLILQGILLVISATAETMLEDIFSINIWEVFLLLSLFLIMRTKEAFVAFLNNLFTFVSQKERIMKCNRCKAFFEVCEYLKVQVYVRKRLWNKWKKENKAFFFIIERTDIFQLAFVPYRLRVTQTLISFALAVNPTQL